MPLLERQTGESFPIPENSRLAYCIDVAEVLRSTGKHTEADRLAQIANNPLDMYTFDPDCYELLNRGFSMDDFRGGKHPFKRDGDFAHPYIKD